MKVSELADILQSKAAELDPEAEVLVRDEEGLLLDFTLADTEASFDGWDGYTPEGIAIVPEYERNL